MSGLNARIIETDAFALIPAGAAGSSATIDLFGSSGGSSRFSCQAVIDVQAPSAAVIATANIAISTAPTNPSTFTKAAHGFATGLVVRATTAGTLAAPLALATDYFVIRVSDSVFALATTQANALLGTRIAISSVGVTSTTLTATALSGASVTFQKSNDGLNWIDLQVATSITVDATVIVEVANVSYRYFKAVKALTAGQVDLKALVLAIGASQ